jgi:hypothetical protein
MYIKPSMKVREAQPIQMLAESLAIISGENVSGDNALTKEDDAWEFFNEEE